MNKRNISKKRATYILVIAQILIMIGLSVFVTIAVSERAGNSTVEHMKTISDIRATIIKEYVSNTENMLSIYSCNPEIIEAVKNPSDENIINAAQKFTEDFSSKIENLEGIYVSEWNTHVLAHTNRKVVGITTREGEPLEQLRDLLIQAGDGVYDTGIIISPASGKQIVSMYKGIFDEEGNPISVVGSSQSPAGLK